MLSLNFRRLLYITFIIVFAVLSYSIILRAAGFKYHSKKQTFAYTGGIFLEFNTSDLIVRLNDKILNRTELLSDSYRISDLLPGFYQITATRDGYLPWQKNVEVISGKTKILPNITLFKSSAIPQAVITGEILTVVSAPDNKKFLVIARDENDYRASLVDTEINQTFLVAANLAGPDAQVEFSSDSQKLFILDQERLAVYTLKPIRLLNTWPNTEIALSNLKWSTDNSNVVGQSKHNLYFIDILSRTIKLEYSFSVEITDFTIHNGQIHFIAKENPQLFVFDSIKAKEEKLLDLSDNQFRFKESPEPYLTLLDEENNALLIIDPTERQIILKDSARALHWGRQGTEQKIVYYNDFELYIFNLGSRKKDLINRYSVTIDKALWHNNDYYILVLIDNSLYAVEILDSSQQFFKLFASNSQLADFFRNDNSKTLYFTGEIAQKSGFYQLIIQ